MDDWVGTCARFRAFLPLALAAKMDSEGKALEKRAGDALATASATKFEAYVVKAYKATKGKDPAARLEAYEARLAKFNAESHKDFRLVHPVLWQAVQEAVADKKAKK